MTDGRNELFDYLFMLKYREIERLLEEAYRNQERSGDYNWKSGEGWIQISMPERFWTELGNNRPEILIYSYALGPSRNHSFKNIDEALKEVQKWHKEEMEYDYKEEIREAQKLL